MADRPLVIVGISGFGRETADVVDAMRRPIAGFLDDNPSASNLELINQRADVFLGRVNEWLTAAPPHDYLIGIGSGSIRERLANTLDAAGHHAAVAIHPSVTMGWRVRISPGVVICAGARVSNNVALGRHAHLNPSAVIGHDASVGLCVSINPSATISGNVVIEDRTLVGAGATILQNLRIGADVTIGASALVTKNVPPNVTVTGLPGSW